MVAPDVLEDTGVDEQSGHDVKCAIMQPTYLPWAGYFNLIASVDKFVFLDDVQLERQSWQTRNRILLNGMVHLLVVPIKRSSLTANICQAIISPHDPRWYERHWKTLCSAYIKSSYGKVLLEILEPLYTSSPPLQLAQWNIRIIKVISDALGLRRQFFVSSELGCEGGRVDKLISICELLGGSRYRAPAGAENYLRSDFFTSKTEVALEIQRFIPAPYKQLGRGQFVSHLSICDVIANMGIEQTKNYIEAPLNLRSSQLANVI